MNGSRDTIAVIFDFDDTLVPDSTTFLLEKNGFDKKRIKSFWTNDVKSLVRSGYDPTLAFLKAFLENVGLNKPLGQLSNQKLRDFGKRLDDRFYDGLPELFSDLRKIVKRFKKIRIDIEFYIVSGGLQEVIEGSKTITDVGFSGIYGCLLDEDPTTNEIRYIKRAISFTEKTRYLFEINKGIDPKKGRRNPLLVNREVQPGKRRIPFKNMIYVGDGLTDIPCFSLVKKEGGVTFGVFNPAKSKSAKTAFIEFLKPARVISMHAPKYRKTDELGSFLRQAVGTRCNKINLERGEAEKST